MERTPLTKDTPLPMKMTLHLNMGSVHHSSYRNEELGISMGKRSERLKGGKYNVVTSFSFDANNHVEYDSAEAFMKAYNDHYFPENNGDKMADK